MKTTGRSTLQGKFLRFVGFGFLDHPTKRGWFLQVSFYTEASRATIICTSEGKGQGDVEQAKEGLGGHVPGEMIAPFAQRKLDTTDLTIIKKAFAEEYPNATWYWYSRKQDV